MFGYGWFLILLTTNSSPQIDLGLGGSPHDGFSQIQQIR